MKKIILLLLPIFLLQFINCKPEGKGTLVLTLESSSSMSADVQQKTIEALKQRLQRLKIDEEDIVVTPKENRLELKISGMSNYPAEILPRIRNAVTADGSVEFWETYRMAEIVPLFAKRSGRTKTVW